MPIAFSDLGHHCSFPQSVVCVCVCAVRGCVVCVCVCRVVSCRVVCVVPLIQQYRLIVIVVVVTNGEDDFGFGRAPAEFGGDPLAHAVALEDVHRVLIEDAVVDGQV